MSREDDELDIFLDDLLDSNDDPVALVIEENIDESVPLDDLLPAPVFVPEPLSEEPLDDLTMIADMEEGGEVSFVSDNASTLLTNHPRQIRLKNVLAADLRDNPVRVALRLMSQEHACRPVTNPVDELLSEGQLRQLVAALQQAEAQVLEGDQIALIIARGEHSITQLTPGERLALHYNAAPLGGVVILKMAASEQQLRIEMLRRGLKENLDFEFCAQESLFKYERQLLSSLMGRTKAKLRIFRRLSKKSAKTGK